MKLNPDLMRAVLLFVEEEATLPVSQLDDIQIDGYGPDDITYHVVLANESGFVKARIYEDGDDEDPDVTHVSYCVERLTYRGHEFLGMTAEPENWSKIKGIATKAGAKTADAMFDVAKALIAQKIKDQFNL